MTAASITNAPGPLQSWILSTIADIEPVDAEQRASVVRAVRDTIGVSLAGSTQASVQWAVAYANSAGTHGPAPAWVTGRSLDRSSAALVNGTSVQALEFDDIAPALAAHLSSVMVPTMSSFVDEIDSQLAVDGIVAALRVAASLADLIGFTAHSRGLQPTHTVGPLAAVIAVAHALGLDEAQQSAALGLAVTGSLGLRANTGVRAKALQSGLAAAAAVRAIELARRAPDMALGASSVDSVFAILGADDATIADVVSRPLPAPAFLAVKPYPTSGAAHSSVEALLDVRTRFGASTVPASMEVHVPPRVLSAMGFVRPQIADEARWSIRYVLATAWEQGDVDVADFADDVVRSSSERRDPEWLQVVADADFAPRGEQAHVTVWSDGQVESAVTEQRLGYPGRTLDGDRVRAKFDRCLDAAGRAGDAAELWEAIGTDPIAALAALGA